MADADQTLETLGGIALGAIFEDYEGAAPLEAVEDAASGKLIEQPGDTRVAVEHPRGNDGRFIPKAEPEGFTEEVPVESVEEAVSEPETAETAEEETPDDTATAVSEEEDALVLEIEEELLDLVNDKYGGDIGKALRGLQEAQSLIGRQGTELGELRELRSQVDSLRELMSLQQQAASVDWEDAIADDPEQAVLLAVQYQNPAAFESALEAWAAVEPIKAFTFLTDIQQQAAAPPPTTLDAEMDALKARHPDIQQRLPAIQVEAEKRPALARLLNDQDPRTRAQALEDLYHLSGGAGTPDTSAAGRRIYLKAKAEAEAAKADAAVVSASNTAPPPAPPKSGDSALAETLQEYLGLGDDFKIVG